MVLEVYLHPPTKPVATVWREPTRQAGPKGLRLHNLRDQAIAELAETNVTESDEKQGKAHVCKMLEHYDQLKTQADAKANVDHRLESLRTKYWQMPWKSALSVPLILRCGVTSNLHSLPSALTSLTPLVANHPRAFPRRNCVVTYNRSIA